jgi:hypothetical protein
MPTAYQMLTKGISSFSHPHFDELLYFVDCLIKDESSSPTVLDCLDFEALYKAYMNLINL